MSQDDTPEPKEWNPDSVLEGIVLERNHLREASTFEEHIKHIIRTNAPFAAKAIVHLAMYSESERMRFDAARYIIDHAVGKAGGEGFFDERDDRLVGLMQEIYVKSTSN